MLARFVAPLIALLCCTAVCAQDDRGFELGFATGFVQLDRDVVGPAESRQQPTLGLRAAYDFTPRWTVALDALYEDFETGTFRGSATSWTGRAAAEWTFTPRRTSRWFVAAGLGYMNLAFDNATDFTSATAALGVGQRIRMSGPVQVRWELRADRSLARDGFVGEDLTRIGGLVGFSFDVGGRRGRYRRSSGKATSAPPPPVAAPAPASQPAAPAAPLTDGDGDGVDDSRDLCPATLGGIEVGPEGCPLDEDRDGVYDGLGMDRCPGTPTGARVDRHGCPLDGDGDGVWDGLDECPGSLAGGTVDARGCP